MENSSNRSVNRLFLALILVYLAGSFGIGWIFRDGLPVLASLLLGQGMVVVPGLVYCRIKQVKLFTDIPYRKIKLSTGLLVILGTYLMYPLMVVLNALTLLVTKSSTAAMMTSVWDWSLPVGLGLVALLPACVEEFVFRGVFFQTYRKGRLLPAVLLSGVLFGCMHLNLNQFLYAFVLGIFLALLVEATGSILSSMLAHFTLNATGVALSYLMQGLSSGAEQYKEQLPQGNLLDQLEGSSQIVLLMGILIWAMIAAGTTALAVLVYIGICKNCGRWELVKKNFRFRPENRERLITPCLLAGMALAAVVMVLRF